jgi:hypothetical protein
MMCFNNKPKGCGCGREAKKNNFELFPNPVLWDLFRVILLPSGLIIKNPAN